MRGDARINNAPRVGVAARRLVRSLGRSFGQAYVTVAK